MQRYFALEKQEEFLFLGKEDRYHIVTVMRLQEQDQIEIVYQERVFLCQIDKIEKNSVRALICQDLDEDRQMDASVTLAQALVKEAKMDFILQKNTELGVSSFLPFMASRCVVKYDQKQDKKLERWKKIVKEASEQSKRLVIPDVLSISNIDKLCQLDYDVKLLCTVNELSTTMKRVLSNVKKGDKLIVVIGPEGGFTEEEEQKLINAGYQSISLSKLVLRTETAGMASMSYINYHFMR